VKQEKRNQEKRNSGEGYKIEEKLPGRGIQKKGHRRRGRK